MKEVSLDPLRQWTSQGLRLSDLADETFRSADDTNSFTMLVGRAVERLCPRLVVDLGCGCGIPTVEAGARGARSVHGVDISEANASLARRNVALAGLDHRIKVHCDDWRALMREAEPDLVVTNPPYVPQGVHTAVDGGPDGADVIRAMVDAISESTRTLALLFGSISNPVSVIQHIEQHGWRVRWMTAHVVPFGPYTSRPATLEVLRELQRDGRAWFHEQRTDMTGARRSYVVFGVMAERAADASRLTDAMTFMLARFQRDGTRGLRRIVMPIPFNCGVYRAAPLNVDTSYTRLEAGAADGPGLAGRGNMQIPGEPESLATGLGSLITTPGAPLAENAS